jgi:hypothetical protein
LLEEQYNFLLRRHRKVADAATFCSRERAKLNSSRRAFAMAGETPDRSEREEIMKLQNSVSATALALVLIACGTTARAFDDTKYPDLSGQWFKQPVPGIVGQAVPGSIRQSHGAWDSRPR